MLESRTPREFQVLALIAWFLSFCSLLLENHLSRAIAAVVMLGIVNGFSRTRSDSLGALFVAGVSGVLVFGAALAVFRWPEVRRRLARPQE